MRAARVVGARLAPTCCHRGMKEGDASIAPTSDQTFGSTIPCCAWYFPFLSL